MSNSMFYPCSTTRAEGSRKMIALQHRSSSTPAGTSRRGGVFAALQVWLERREQRRALLNLSDPMLKDIGLSRADAWAEGSKPFWRP